MAMAWLVMAPTASIRPASGTGRGNLVADIARVVQIVAAFEHRLDQAAKMGDQLLAAGRRRVRLPQHFTSQADVFRRMPPGQHSALARFDHGEVVGQQFDQPMAGRAQKFRVVSRLDPLACRVELRDFQCHILEESIMARERGEKARTEKS